MGTVENTYKQETIAPLTLDRKQAQERYNLGVNSINKVAEEAAAVIRIGRRKLYLLEKMDEYFRDRAE